MAKILAFTEQRDGAVRRSAYEVVSAARRLADALGGGEVHALVLGSAGLEGVDTLGGFGADTVHVGEADAFQEYNPEGHARAVTEAVQKLGCDVVLFPGSSEGKDLAPRVAARLDVPLASDATGLDVDGGEVVVTRPVYGGRAFAKVTLEGSPKLVSLRPNVFRAEEKAGQGNLETLDVSADPGEWRTRVRERKEVAGERPDVAEAPAVVAGGRGMREPDNWKLLEDLCDAIGPRCALGASRAVVDAGWRPHAEQVGQTGKTVAPQLYIAVGISGAMQHLAGMRTSGTIVAINRDADAPIFKIADYGIVGDVFEVLPRLAEEIRKARG